MTERGVDMAGRETVLLVNRFHPETIKRLDGLYNTHKLWEAGDEAAQRALIERIAPHCRIAATAAWHCSPLVYELPELELLSCFGVGTDGIDFNITSQQSITVTNTPDVLNDAVADLALSLILATHRNLIQADQHVRSGSWHKAAFPFSLSLAGRTLGIAGLGAIGEEIALRALPCKMDIAYHNRRQRPELSYRYHDSLESLAEASDVLLSMLPGGEATNKLVGESVFRALGPEGIFINVGRGTTVDETALIRALQEGMIAGAGLDVYRNEPMVPAELIDLPNVVLFPHIGSATVETRRAMGQLVLDNIEAFVAGRPLLTPTTG